MDTTGDSGAGGQRPGGQGVTGSRAGQSGEGARTALEQLIQQENRRQAQLPRDTGTGAPTSPDA
jgi:hypothetical protein